ncbi:hypothetical protein RRF57_012609 [Xylaria bambusicola]|uniref:Uncharacterized protein n=1 Tax=Xylaria bambusicola TaxID=326684 RepID=A0AAN7UVG5_9PEZI
MDRVTILELCRRLGRAYDIAEMSEFHCFKRARSSLADRGNREGIGRPCLFSGPSLCQWRVTGRQLWFYSYMLLSFLYSGAPLRLEEQVIAPAKR